MNNFKIITLALIITVNLISIPQVTIADTLWNTSGNNIYNTNSENVGIGITNALEKLHVYESSTRNVLQLGSYGAVGSIHSSGDYMFGNNVKPAPSGTNAMHFMQTHATLGGRALRMGGANGITFHATSSSVTAGDTFTSEVMRITNSGNVGIGDSTPTSLLTVGAGDLFQVTSLGRVLANIGSATTGNLSYSFVEDTDTGMYRSDSNEIDIVAGGVKMLHITSNGVGIKTNGNDSDSSVGLQVGHSTVNGQISLGGTNTHIASLRSSGSLAFMNNAYGKYDSGADNDVVYVKNTGAYGAGTFKIGQTSSFGLPLIYYAKSGSVTSGEQLNVPANEMFRVDTSGNFGIGTSTPTSKLSVDGDVQVTNNLVLGGNIVSDGDICIGQCE